MPKYTGPAEASEPVPKYTVDDLLAQAQSSIDTLNYDLAYRFCQRAVEMAPTHTGALEQLAVVELEIGQYESALQHLRQCITLVPDTGFSKYMYLGQMSTEMEAINYFNQGVAIMKRELEQLTAVGDEAAATAVRSQMASALCSMAEIYLTDCCFQPEAESSCEKYLNEALTLAPENADVHQLLASVRLSQQRSDEAKECLLRSIALWSSQGPDSPNYPSYDARIATTKLLLELGLYSDALKLLEALQKEDDQTVDLWYLYGWTYYCMAEEKQAVLNGQDNGASTTGDVEDEADDDEEGVTALLTSAAECLMTAVQIYERIGYDDEGLLAHARELFDIINQRVPLASLQDQEEPDDGGGGDEGWEDLPSSGDEEDMAVDA
ncbi:hypothetical protein IWQ60_003230 [Tieghemiomyces parasiticus]|uniref:TPR-like protein n=1 Tax=Tieghemiomyces parasiticus TaxID=78921 RepID=A0A9W8AD89_9FUNG|nr:hypothetical protein IWQ60_003230 [Tieghemiomyces parasiticus]